MISKAMRDNEDCRNLFSDRDDPVTILKNMASNSDPGHGQIRFDRSIGTDAITDPKQKSGHWNDSLGTWLYPDVDIVINSGTAASGYWLQTGAVERARMLLHELGHVFEFRFGKDSTAFRIDARPDGTANMDIQKANQALERKCF